MNDDGLPSREGGVRPRTRDGRGAAPGFVRAIAFAVGLVATLVRAAAAIGTAQMPPTPLLRRVSAFAGSVLEIANDPFEALATLAIVATVCGAIATWRRSAGAAAIVAVALLVAIASRAA